MPCSYKMGGEKPESLEVCNGQGLQRNERRKPQYYSYVRFFKKRR